MVMQNVVVDDLRSFKDDMNGETVYARTSAAGLETLELYSLRGIVMLWLDHDLGILENGDDDTIMPVVDYLCKLASEGTPYPAEIIVIHTSNPVGRNRMKASLDRWGYRNIVVHDASEYFVVEGD